MRPTAHYTLFLMLLVPLLAGCPPERGTDDDDDDDSPFGSLDRDGDGDLDADDVDSGEAAAAFTLDFEDEDGEPDVTEEQVTTTEVSLSQTTVAWSLDATFEELNLSLRIELDGPLVAGTWPVSSGSANHGEDWWAYTSDAGGDVVISAVGSGIASGHFVGTAEIDVYGPYEEPTGETVVVEGFAFRDAPVYPIEPAR